MNRINLSQYTGKENGDQISASDWNGVFGTIQTAINGIEDSSSTPQGIDTEGVVSVNSKGNTVISSTKHINLEPVYDENGLASGTYGDVQIKPGDDITLESHHRAESKRNEITVKTSNGLSGNDKAPVKLQIIADDMTLSTKGKKGDDSNVMNVNVTTGEGKGYLKVRAQAIDLRSETHGGIALQPKGEDGQGHMNKIKFEHGGGDGLEFGTFNAEKTSIFTDEYRFNKDGVWKMATRTKVPRSNVDDKKDANDPTTHYYYEKQQDDFYDNISNNDATTTTKAIIDTANALNGGAAKTRINGTVLRLDGILQYRCYLADDDHPEEGLLEGNILFDGDSRLGEFTPDNIYSERDIVNIINNANNTHYTYFTDIVDDVEEGSEYTINEEEDVYLCTLNHWYKFVPYGKKEIRSTFNRINFSNNDTELRVAGNTCKLNDIVNLTKNADANANHTSNFNFKTDAKFTAILYVNGTTYPEVWANTTAITYDETQPDIINNTTTQLYIDCQNSSSQVSEIFDDSLYLSWRVGYRNSDPTSVKCLSINADDIFYSNADNVYTPYDTDDYSFYVKLDTDVTGINSSKYLGLVCIAHYDTTVQRYKARYTECYILLNEGGDFSKISSLDLKDSYYNNENVIKPDNVNYDPTHPNLIQIVCVDYDHIYTDGNNHTYQDVVDAQGDHIWITENNSTVEQSIIVKRLYVHPVISSQLTYNNSAVIGTLYSDDQLLSMFTWTGQSQNPITKELLSNVSNNHIIGIRYDTNDANHTIAVIAFRKTSEDVSIVSGGTLNLIGNTNFGSRFNFGPTYNGIEAQWTKDNLNVESAGDMLRVVAVNDGSEDFTYDSHSPAIKPGERKVIAECSILDIIRLVLNRKKYSPGWFNKVDKYTPTTIGTTSTDIYDDASGARLYIME